MKLPFLCAQHVSKQRAHMEIKIKPHTFLLLRKISESKCLLKPLEHAAAALEQSPFQAQRHPLNYKSIWLHKDDNSCIKMQLTGNVVILFRRNS